MLFIINLAILKYKEYKKVDKKKIYKARTKLRLINIIYSFMVFLIFFNNIQAEETVEDSLGFNSYITTIEEYVNSSDSKDVADISDIANQLVENKDIKFDSIILNIIKKIFTEVVFALKGAITIYIVILLMSVLSSLELDKDSSITKIAYFVCFLAISTIIVKTFSDTLLMFRSTVNILTTLMQIISPFLMAILIATGAISSTGIIQPMLLFMASLVSFIVNYLVIPFVSISLAFNIVNSLTDKIKLTRLSKLFSKTAMWVVAVIFTVFLGILSLETSITSSVDTLAVKTTQAAVSNFVPVVGKFFSDSFETVVGATKVISRVGGTIGILAVILITIIPIIKILSVMLVYNILSALAEPICSESKIITTLDMFADTYKTLLGILIGITILFIISTGIILNLSSSIIK